MGQPNQRPAEASSSMQENFIQTSDMDVIIAAARRIGERLWSDGVKTNQLRNFYEAVVQLKIDVETDRRQNKASTDTPIKSQPLLDRAKLLPTRLAWSAAKALREDERRGLGTFYRDMEKVVKGLFRPEEGDMPYDRFVRFQQFVETIVVYHKAKESRVI